MTEQQQANDIRLMATKYFACDPTVVGVQLFLLVDEKYRNGRNESNTYVGGGWQSGLVTAGGEGVSVPKSSYAQSGAALRRRAAPPAPGPLSSWSPGKVAKKPRKKARSASFSTVTTVAAIADTHLPRGARRLPEACVERLVTADLIVHAGDLSSAAFLADLRALGPPVHAVRGNADEPALRALLPAELIVEAGGARIGLMHIPGPAAGREGRLLRRFPAATRWSSAIRTSRSPNATTASGSSTRARRPNAAAARFTQCSSSRSKRGGSGPSSSGSPDHA